jgi:hypothetical protein
MFKGIERGRRELEGRKEGRMKKEDSMRSRKIGRT